MNQRCIKKEMTLNVLFILFQPKKINFNAGTNSVVMDEKMKSRAQRFGLA